jgi:hypothetical protein
MALLQDLIDHLAKGQVRTMAELAQRLDVDPALVVQMLADLERAGYVRQVSASCDEQCASCPQSSQCGLHYDGRLWAVTPKAFEKTRR